MSHFEKNRSDKNWTATSLLIPLHINVKVLENTPFFLYYLQSELYSEIINDASHFSQIQRCSATTSLSDDPAAQKWLQDHHQPQVKYCQRSVCVTGIVVFL